jgi:phosphoadenosine phosphosulfate reductase
MNLFGEEQDLIAIERIKTFCPPEGYYVAFSGGKDSVVILDLVKRAGVPFDAHYSITGIDPPELVRFIRTEYPDVQRHRPEKTIWQLIVEKRMPPTRKVKYCCQYLKEGGGNGRTVLTGIRWEESTRRKNTRKMTEACFRDSRKFYINPIIDWSGTDVWEYIKSHGIAYCCLYDEGFKRLGCIMCPESGKQQLVEAVRWPRYKALYIMAFQRCIDKRIVDGLKTTWRTGQEMYDWWIENSRRTYVDPDQTVLFE